MENKIRYQFRRLPIVLFITISVVAGMTRADDTKMISKAFKITRPLVLNCNLTNKSDAEKVVWKKKSGDEDSTWKNVKDIPALKGRFQIYQKEATFSIERSAETDEGNYSCSVDDVEIQKYKVFATLIVKVPENIYVVEEEKLEIVCVVKGSNPTITWDFRPENSNETTEIGDKFEEERFELSTENGIDNAKLTIKSAELKDRGYYICNGRNEIDDKDDSVASEGLVRVKDKLAALWPFLGICAEVFVLCAIILIYEKRRNKTDDADSDTDQSPDQKNDHHRK